MRLLAAVALWGSLGLLVAGLLQEATHGGLVARSGVPRVLVLLLLGAAIPALTSVVVDVIDALSRALDIPVWEKRR